MASGIQWKVDTYPNIRTVKTVNVYRFKDINGQYVLNSGGVPLEMYNQNSADAYLAANTNNRTVPRWSPFGPKERADHPEPELHRPRQRGDRTGEW